MIAIAALPLSQVVVRLAWAAVAGCVVGLERELRGRTAGLRTTMLACIAGASAMILGGELFGTGSESSRIIQGVMTGMGFLGAGAINREGRLIRGLTSAAVLWMVTILGLIFGAGQWPYGL